MTGGLGSAAPPPNIEKLQEAKDDRQWLQLLSMTTDSNLQPRDKTVALLHWEALHRLGWDASILVKDWTWIPAENWQNVLDWQHRAQPLATWY
jgi:hypothetical protein